MRKHFNIPIFVPHEGCPHDCVFCNQKKITGHDHAQGIGDAKREIESFLSSLKKHKDDYSVEIAFFGGSFTGIDQALQNDYLQLANRYIKSGLIDGIRLSTRPDYIDDTIISRLKSYGVTCIELGVQSLVEDVLALSNRGHSLDSVYKACKVIKDNGIKLGLQMMIGLPGDTIKKSLETAQKIIDLNPDMVRIYPTIVIEGTELESLYRQGLYKALDFSETVEWSAEIYKRFIRRDIPVIRIGLQASESLNERVAGPYHPSFRQFVESYLYYQSLSNFIEKNRVTGLSLYCHSKEISNLVGQKRDNLIRLEEKYNLDKIKVYPKEMPTNSFEVHVGEKVFKVPKITII